MLNYPTDFWTSVFGVLLNSAQHAPSYHKYFLVPIFAVILVFGVSYRKLSMAQKKNYNILLMIVIINLLIAIFYGICCSKFVVDLKNQSQGFFRYFQIQRVYFAYPTLWYLAFALALSLVMKEEKIRSYMLRTVLILALTVPSVYALSDLNATTWMINVRQMNSLKVGEGGLDILSWKQYYAEDLMEEIKGHIGAEQSSYRVASLGMSPVPSLMAGFYTIDGYSNNYDVSYKHAFREIIEKELEKNSEMEVYFDTWGSRCCLLNAETGNYMYLSKTSDFAYQNLELDTEKMKEMGCRYIISAAEINHYQNLNLSFEKSFETKDSYYKVWLYSIN